VSDSAILQIAVDLDEPIFDSEVVIDERNTKNLRPVFGPWLPSIDDIDLPAEMTDALWEEFEAEPEEATENLKQDVTLIGDAENDAGEELILESPQLKLISYGRIFVRIYGPEKVKHPVSGLDVNLDHEIAALDPLDGIDVGDGETPAFSYWDSKWKEKVKKPWAAFKLTGKIGGRQYARTYVFSGNRAGLGGDRVKKNGRKEEWFRETLTFNGETSKRIKYWYVGEDQPIFVRYASDFFVKNKDGGMRKVQRPLNGECTNDNTCVPPSSPNSPVISTFLGISSLNTPADPGTTFKSMDGPCWGMLIIEYKVSYAEFEVLYDYEKEIKRSYRVGANRPQRIGFVTYDAEGNKKDISTSAPGGSFSADKTLTKKEAGDREAQEFGYKIFPKIEFVPYTPTPQVFIYSNTFTAKSLDWTPPEPDFSEIPSKDLPRISIFERRRRYRVYPNGASTGSTYAEIDRTEELKLIDALGNLSEERIEK
jgi:hypothetical protein